MASGSDDDSLEDLFSSFEIGPSYPFHNDRTNSWFRQTIARSSHHRRKRREVDMINVSGGVDRAVNRITKRENTRHYHETLYFHGTTADDAENILYEGIDLSKGASGQDFSDGYGFYLTENKTQAAKWACQRAGNECSAVIAFKINDEMQNPKEHLSLYSNFEKWQRIVTHFRNNESSQRMMRKLERVKSIEGWVCRNPHNVRRGADPKKNDDEYTQLCILDQEYADYVGKLRNIAFVVFFD